MPDFCSLITIFCTRWTGLYKDDAISSVEHRANLVLLLKYGMDFIKNYTMSGWVKMPNYRLNLPDYSDRAIFEGLVNHLIHRDYTVMGGEVHIDIYDDRVELCPIFTPQPRYCRYVYPTRLHGETWFRSAQDA